MGNLGGEGSEIGKQTEANLEKSQLLPDPSTAKLGKARGKKSACNVRKAVQPVELGFRVARKSLNPNP